MKFGLQHPNYSFDYRNHDNSQILDSLKNLEDVLKQKELFEEAGIQYIIVDLDPSKGLEALNNFVEIIKKS